tara:strand:- start:264 stop:563 length:300 start_codon:yes stop_codon:yes gene_type:complete
MGKQSCVAQEENFTGQRQRHIQYKYEQEQKAFLQEIQGARQMTVAMLSQKDFQTFKKKVAILRGAGIELEYSVAKPNHKKVKVTMHTPIDAQKWDRVCG